jgi:hypothetical protein
LATVPDAMAAGWLSWLDWRVGFRRLNFPNLVSPLFLICAGKSDTVHENVTRMPFSLNRRSGDFLPRFAPLALLDG